MHLPVGGDLFALDFGLARARAKEPVETRRVETVVVALIPEYHQVKVRDGDGHLYALTRKTQGVDLGALCEGQRVVCTVTRKLPRVLTAAAAA